MLYKSRQSSLSSPLRRLVTELKQLEMDPDCKWFKITPNNEFSQSTDGPNGYVWKWVVEIYGFKDTIYEGYTLTAEILFPPDYPLSPPRVYFTTKMYHPNIYEDGKVCISILHTMQTDPHTNELEIEQWTPVLCVRTILLSIMLLLNEPNTDSPANIEASKHYRESPKEYEEYVRRVILSQYPKKTTSETGGVEE